jgi:polar amino acid transport system substrate-binding protein
MRKAILMMASLLLALSARSGQAATVSACAEPSEGPPWYYLVKDAAGKRTGKAAGATVDMLTLAFAKSGTQIQFRSDLPFIRCMEMVAARQIDFAIGPYYDPERAKRYAYSAPYKVLTPQIFFSARRPIQVSTVQDLARYRGCGMHGWSYAHYGLKEADLDQGASTYSALLMKLKIGRCDYFPEELESLATHGQGKDSLLNDPELRHVPVAGAIAPGNHLVTAKDNPAAQLLPKFNAALAAMIKGYLEKKRRRDHSLTSPGCGIVTAALFISARSMT